MSPLLKVGWDDRVDGAWYRRSSSCVAATYLLSHTSSTIRSPWMTNVNVVMAALTAPAAAATLRVLSKQLWCGVKGLTEATYSYRSVIASQQQQPATCAQEMNVSVSKWRQTGQTNVIDARRLVE